MKRGWVIVLMAVLAISRLHGAELGVESFDGAPFGWTPATEFGIGAWAVGGGEATVTFFDTGTIPVPESGSLRHEQAVPTPLTGDFRAAGVELIGFRFLAPTLPPSGVALILDCGSSVFHRLFQVEETGGWVTLAASVESAEAGGWKALAGSISSFDEALRDVRAVNIRVARSGVATVQYKIDEVFLGLRPAWTAVTAGESGPEAQLGNLFGFAGYRMERATDLIAGDWEPAADIAPDDAPDVGFLRAVME